MSNRAIGNTAIGGLPWTDYRGTDKVGKKIHCRVIGRSGMSRRSAFIEAGYLALIAIAILLALALRRLTDVLLTLIPLLLAGAVTLQISVLWGLSLNFANIVALPLLLGVGVAFKIYYIVLGEPESPDCCSPLLRGPSSLVR